MPIQHLEKTHSVLTGANGAKSSSRIQLSTRNAFKVRDDSLLFRPIILIYTISEP